MRIAISATNPCHLYDMARALHVRNALGAYFSGYPGWRLHPPADFPLRTHSLRTLVTYSMLRLPRSVRPADHRLFRWQDTGFDRAVASHLDRDQGTFIHALPGQALATFRRAKEIGLKTVLNHASGPVRQQLAIMEAEYRRINRQGSDFHGFDAAYFRRAADEYTLADFHCVASTLVRSQLVAEGVAAERIWVAPYGADPAVFKRAEKHKTPSEPARIVFAGQLTLRKGLRSLLAAFKLLRQARPARLDLYGPNGADFDLDRAEFAGTSGVCLHGPVSRMVLAHVFQQADVLVLPSLEEAFGLVVPQALNCGLPCIVSDQVGAKDLIQPRINGSVYPVGDAETLAGELGWWLDHPDAFRDAGHGWDLPAGKLLELSRTALHLS